MSDERRHRFFQIVPENINIDFAKQRFFWIGVSVLLMIFAIVEFQVVGLKLGIEFSPGADIRVRFDEPVTTAEVREALQAGGVKDAVVQTIDEPLGVNLEEGIEAGAAAGALSPEFLIKVKAGEIATEDQGDAPLAAETPVDGELPVAEESGTGEPVQGEPEAAADEAVEPLLAHEGLEAPAEERSAAYVIDQVKSALAAKFGPQKTETAPEGTWEVRRQEATSAGAVAELTRKGFETVAFATIFIFIYIVFRFSQTDWMTGIGYGVGAVVCIVHDIAIVFAALIISGRELSLTVVAALLTVIGYSLNDTIVVYDRIRENHLRYRSRDLWETINRSVNDSLSRTLITSLTTLLVLACLYIFGGSVINDFAFVLIIGIIVGTFSSVFIASPTFVYTTQALKKLRGEPTEATARARTPRV